MSVSVSVSVCVCVCNCVSRATHQNSHTDTQSQSHRHKHRHTHRNTYREGSCSRRGRSSTTTTHLRRPIFPTPERRTTSHRTNIYSQARIDLLLREKRKMLGNTVLRRVVQRQVRQLSMFENKNTIKEVRNKFYTNNTAGKTRRPI